ncbi:MAG: adenylate/guanylate cyclase domain-containing protein [Hydrogenophaga sp.]
MVQNHSNTASSTLGEAAADSLVLLRHQSVLVLDLVASVRLMALDEAGAVRRWVAFINHVRTHILPLHQGRMVKSLGDGLLAVFDCGHAATQAALMLQRYFGTVNMTLTTEQHMLLRIGIHTSDLYTDGWDLYGQGVNLAARVAGLGQAGDIVVTSAVKEPLTKANLLLDDMGETMVRHWPYPVRTWRVRAATEHGAEGR